MLGLALRQLLEATRHPAQSPPATPWRKLLEKAELVTPLGTASLLYTMRLPGFWPSTGCPKTRLATWRSHGIRSLLPQRGFREAGRGVPGGGKPLQASHCLEGAGEDMGWVMRLRSFSFLFPLYVRACARACACVWIKAERAL